MAARHVETNVRPEHYPKVADALLPAIRDVLGAEAATDEVLAAWGEAYWFLADVLIHREAQLYVDEKPMAV
jgi:hemoglobin-like flavoprotein